MTPKFKINQKVWYLDKDGFKCERVTRIHIDCNSRITTEIWEMQYRETEYKAEPANIKYGLGTYGYNGAGVPEEKVYASKAELKRATLKWANALD